jgi:hypothetical protein
VINKTLAHTKFHMLAGIANIRNYLCWKMRKAYHTSIYRSVTTVRNYAVRELRRCWGVAGKPHFFSEAWRAGFERYGNCCIAAI